MCQQEEGQSLVNVLGENVDKMQLTRRILDLKQVRIVKKVKKYYYLLTLIILIINRNLIEHTC